MAMKNTMQTSAWVTGRILAGVASAALTGAIGEALIWLFMLFSGHFRDGGGNVSSFSWAVVWGAGFGVAFGAVPAIAVMCFTRARARPWASVLRVLAGSVPGLLLLGAVSSLVPSQAIPSIGAVLIGVAGPTLGALVAVRFLIPRVVVNGKADVP